VKLSDCTTIKTDVPSGKHDETRSKVTLMYEGCQTPAPSGEQSDVFSAADVVLQPAKPRPRKFYGWFSGG